MIGTIRPLVQGSPTSLRASTALALYVTGAVVGALVTGTAITIAQAATSHVDVRWRWIILGTIAVGLAAADLGFWRLHTPSSRRQTGAQWPRTIGPRRAWLAWGFDMALGFTTIRVTSLIWVALAASVLVVPSPAGFLVAGAYAAGVTMGLIGATCSLHFRTILQPTFGEIRLLALSSTLAKSGGIISLAVACTSFVRAAFP